ncbi:ribonuclease E inhibitor RraB [Shewanella sp. Actino-trap-3]|jgi:regulator of RNase E activity RraB|uniref:ribonuclease E inhibitor RraB n=1 Tax=Shewanella sp. Actino-trap-3 TaxID=2058331 RepID=UPI000C349226|nr:ribonuclease E inhibitor RraB [Shewanella sp. Actino-trap-3]PKG78014.1 ribonuclease E inhibitor RraB [Shewanella sp. Actino-trap-3]|tara:strand:+ start:251110 stop:251496 length:387 start_codon:yes stop_codon:yes gene_type:complete
MQFPDDDNGQMLAAMADAGIDLTQSIEVDFFLVFDDQRDAESALEALSQTDMQGELEVNFDEESTKWEVIVCLQMVPDYAALVAKETELNSFAQEFDGISDGWGVMQNQASDSEFADDDHVHSEHCKH